VAKRQERFEFVENSKQENDAQNARKRGGGQPSSPSPSARTGRRRTAVGKAAPSTQIPLLFRGDHDTLEEAARRALERRLGGLLREPISVSITNNRHTMLSTRRSGRVTHLRLHHMFLDADDTTVRAMARYLERGERRASERLDSFIEANHHLISKGRTRRTRVRTEGRYHDLGEIFTEVDELYFGGGTDDVQVTWGRRPPANRRGRRSVRLGTYVQDDQLIRMHPVLDQDWVPRFFVAYVLFHEMLHHVVPAPLVNGKRRFHGPEFRKRERNYPDYARAIAWEETNLRRLLST